MCVELIYYFMKIIRINIISGEWGCWTDWSSCSATCGQGTRQRKRHCMSVNNNGMVGSGCEGPPVGEEPCEMISCECKHN